MSEPAPGRQRVLIIDDQKTNLKVLGDILRQDVDVMLAQSAEQGLRKAIEYQPDLILLDVLMPETSGFELIKTLKHQSLTSGIPVIFITALNDSSHEEQGLHLGACDYIYKPFHTAIVQARVRLHLQLARQRRMLEQLAHIDPLTGIANRRKYAQVLDLYWRSAARQQSSLSIVMLDIDHFKEYNDHYGHAAGDKVLHLVANTLKNSLKRPNDFIARYGGEEFVILLPESNEDGSRQLIEFCLQQVKDLHIPHDYSPVSDIITLSAGGVSCMPAQHQQLEAAIKPADDMLYQAKQQGKNQLRWAN
ncbi:GGDEF domain-containing protein [Alkalimonas amylolytica]|uniref:diguanylate cyclase n=1 Tax=Alkalimonas amylolytica TaxID=152573 RepID=A0A1H3ZV89_ALKAM|nr:diguanylate cyclase [Alkalimonas amylolytica]SEA27608.1 response regulator receiver modulated diguanylate cyclase [Alkalimonas amylolytica]